LQVDVATSAHQFEADKMRATLDIDEDVLVAAKELARSQNLSAGQVVSRLLRGY
jgi:hypothetical protein